MQDKLLQRIINESGVDNLVEVLAQQLKPTDLQSLLMEVYRLRAEKVGVGHLMKQYEQNRFVQPSKLDPRDMNRLEATIFEKLPACFEPIEFSPLCPLGAHSLVATCNQDKIVTSIRNTEVLADATNMMALESAKRRRVKTEPVHLCATGRMVRAQALENPAYTASFRILTLTTADRSKANFAFECDALGQHIGFYLELLTHLQGQGHDIHRLEVRLTDLSEQQQRLEQHVLEPLQANHKNTEFRFAPERTTGRGYYRGACFHVFVTNGSGLEVMLIDGGFTDWTQHLLGNKKERFMTSGMGMELLLTLFAKKGSSQP